MRSARDHRRMIQRSAKRVRQARAYFNRVDASSPEYLAALEAFRVTCDQLREREDAYGRYTKARFGERVYRWTSGNRYWGSP